MNKETVLMKEIILALSERGCAVFRNNVGAAWHGNVVYKNGRQVTLDEAYKIPYGLFVGSGDLIGIAPGGKFFSIEVKTKKGRVSAYQHDFVKIVQSYGGVAGIVRSVDEAIELIS